MQNSVRIMALVQCTRAITLIEVYFELVPFFKMNNFMLRSKLVLATGLQLYMKVGNGEKPTGTKAH